MDIELPLDFKEFLKLLNENEVRYLLIGIVLLYHFVPPVMPGNARQHASNPIHIIDHKPCPILYPKSS